MISALSISVMKRDRLIDLDYMRRLSRFAYDMAAEGCAWQSRPSGIEEQRADYSSAASEF